MNIDTKKYENIAEKRDIHYPELERALNVVAQFIKDRNFILYGGMAIDCALKAAGHEGIYSEDTIPDYDFFTPNCYEDSLDLADILEKDGFTNVSSINAIHVTTRRVRVNYVTVADLSYMPKTIFSNLPTIYYAGMRFVHPIFQRLDMHRAFSNPYENPPREVVFHRGKKDMHRFRLLDKAYPISPPAIARQLLSEFKTGKVNSVSVPKDYHSNSVISGLLCYALLHKALLSSIKRLAPTSDASKLLADICPVKVGISGGFTLTLPKSIPTRINIISEEPIKLAHRISEKLKYFKRYMDDLRPRSIETQQSDILYDIYDTKGRLLPCIKLLEMIKIMKSFQAWKAVDINELGDVNVAMAHNPLLYFLTMHVSGGDPVWLYMYWSLSKLVEVAEYVYSNCDLKSKTCKLQPANRDQYLADFAKLPFFLTGNVYGSCNWSYPYVIASCQNYEKVFGSVKTEIRPPHGYYPGKSERVKFAESTWIYDMDGSETSDWSDNLFTALAKIEQLKR